MAWDANGSPMDDNHLHHNPVSVAVPGTSDLFKQYRDALSLSLSDGDTKRLDEIHEAIKASVTSRRA